MNMLSLIFSALIFYSVSEASIRLQADTPKARSIVFHKIDPVESYFLPPESARPTMKIPLSNFGPDIQGGSFIGIKVVGAYEYGTDLITDGTIAVFVGSDDNYIPAGPRSTVFSSFTFPDIEGDFNINTYPSGTQHRLEVPAGALFLKIAPSDTYNFDNSDLNGDYGVEVEVPYVFPLVLDIIQEGQNPDDNGDNLVDVAPGSVELRVNFMPSLQAGNSTIVWKNDASEQQIVFGPNQPLTDYNGNLSFLAQIPDTADFKGPTTLTVTLRNSADQVLAEGVFHVNVRSSAEITIFQNSVQIQDIDNDGISDVIAGAPGEIRVNFEAFGSLSNSTIVLTNTVSQQSTTLIPSGPIPRGSAVFPFTIPYGTAYAGLTEGTLFYRNSSGVVVGQKKFSFDVKAFEVNIFQVIGNPKLHLENSNVDLVSGKNADVEIEFIPNVDISKSEITFSGKGVSRNYPPSSTTTDSDGKVVFRMNPVPENVDLLNFPMTIRLRKANSEILAERTVDVNIRKTKPIILGFVSIESENYSKPVESEYQATYSKGSDLVKLMFPVGDADFRTVRSFLPITGDKLEKNEDRVVLTKLLDNENSILYLSGATRAVGIVGSDYFAHHGFPLRYGEANIGGEAYQVVAGRITTVGHELGHTYCLRYPSGSSCTSGGIWHNPNIELYDGYSNNDLSVSLGIGRGHMKDKTSIMIEGKPDDIPYNYWFSREEYISLFKRNLVNGGVEKIHSPRLLIAGRVDANGHFKRSATYFFNSSREINQDINGEFLFEAKNFENVKLSSQRVRSKISSEEDDSRFIEAAFPIDSETVFIEIFHIRPDGAPTQIGKIVVPSELLAEELKYIPAQAILGNHSQFKQATYSLIENLRQAIQAKDLLLAKEILNSRIYPFLRKNVINSFVPTGALDVGLQKLEMLLATSLVRISALEESTLIPTNPFLKIEEQNSPALGKRHKVKAIFLRDPGSKNYLILHRAFFDGVLIKHKVKSGYLEAESFILSAGQHKWEIQSFIVPAQPWKSLDATVIAWSKEKFDLESSLQFELDPEKRSVIQYRILKLSTNVSSLLSKQNEMLKAIGEPVLLNFGVE